MWSWCPSHFTLGGPRGREHWPSPAWPQPALWAPRGVRISPPVWESPQLWGSLHPVRKGVHAHMHAHGHTHSHLDAHGGSQTYAPRHTRLGGGLESKEVPLAFGPWEVPFPMSLFAGTRLSPLGFPREPSPAGSGDRATAYSSVFLVQTLTARPPSPDTFYLITCHC